MFPDPDDWLPRLQQHAALLEAAADRVRTTSVSSDDIVGRHFAESLELLRLVEEDGSGPPLIDVGPGGGFPGLVIAAVHTDWPITLVEPLKKRADLLVEIAAALNLENVAVEPLRAEEAGRSALRESGATVTARAVAPLPELLEYCAPLARVGGLLVLAKGEAWQSEREAAAHALHELGCEFEQAAPLRREVSQTPVALLIRKQRPVADRYPRRPGMARKRPL